MEKTAAKSLNERRKKLTDLAASCYYEWHYRMSTWAKMTTRVVNTSGKPPGRCSA
jgi:hypothetical protein